MAGTVRLKVISPSVRLPEEERRVGLDTTVAELKQQVLGSLPNPDQLAVSCSLKQFGHRSMINFTVFGKVIEYCESNIQYTSTALAKLL